MNQRAYKDLDFSFEPHPVTGDVLRKVGDKSIIQSIASLLQTGAYERLWQPEIRSRLKEHLFEPIDNITASAIAAEIRTTIDKHEPRVDLTTVNVTPDYDNNGYSVTLTFFIVNRADPIEITLFMERIR